MKKSLHIFMPLLTAGFVLILLITMSNNIERVISLYPPASQASNGMGYIDINTATAEELMLLPGVGEGLAKRIISYRAENGPYQAITDLQQVKGIGAETYRQISPYITVGGLS